MSDIKFIKKKIVDAEHIDITFYDEEGEEVTKPFFFWDIDSSYPLGEQFIYREVNGDYYANLVGDVYSRPDESTIVNMRILE
jgi:hypothetical protein